MWFIIDSYGIYCCVATYCIMMFVSSTVVAVSIIPLGEESYINSILCISIYLIFLILAGISHLQCMLTNPGTIPMNTVQVGQEENGKMPSTVCLRCRCNKNQRTHHCSTCKRCILKMDHHCPWVNNCIGYYNQKHFVLFLFYIMLSCLYSFIMLIIRALYCPLHNEAKLCNRIKAEVSLDLLIGIAGLIVGIIFFLFVSVMLYDQFSYILANRSGIDILKNTTIEQRSARVNLEETFGGRFGILWFLPTKIKRSIVDQIDANEI